MPWNGRSLLIGTSGKFLQDFRSHNPEHNSFGYGVIIPRMLSHCNRLSAILNYSYYDSQKYLKTHYDQRNRFTIMWLEFFIGIIFQVALWLWGWLSL